ncbi:MAG: DNA polymerase III subunit gamma/tau, partial [Sulfuricurvum sp.]|nr:DNA polymerase III subunit gamma/tau [Sulfuricurvum sp.]
RTPMHEIPTAQKSSPLEPVSIHVVPSAPVKSPYELLCDKIRDRSITLGECFTRNVTFLSYENNALTWESCASGEDKELLKNSFGIIRQFVREVYGIDTVIKSQACIKAADEAKVLDEIPNEPLFESTSMVEESEIGVGSCVAQCDETSVKEFDGSDVLNEPMISKAAELFEATKITVQSKV